MANGFVLSREVKPGKDAVVVPSNLVKVISKLQTLNTPAIFSGAGTPTVTATVPSKAGDIYIDTAASKVYIAKAATAAADFLILN